MYLIIHKKCILESKMKWFIALCLLVGLLSVQGKQVRSERARQDLSSYHDQFMKHIETSLFHLNDTLYKWRHYDGSAEAHSYLSQATKHSVDALTHLEDLVTTHSGEKPSKRRNLKQIYDNTSKEEADKRLEEAKARAENKFKNAIGLLQEAAQKAAQNTSAELLNQLNARLEGGNVMSTGKILSQELETIRLASKLFDLTKGLIPGVEEDKKSAPTGEPSNIETSSENDSVSKSNETTLEEDLSAFDFYKEKSAVFDRFDETVGTVPQGTQGPIMRRLSQVSHSDRKNSMIENVEESLKAIRALGEKQLAISKESVQNIKKVARDSREKYTRMIQNSKQTLFRRKLSQDSVIDSSNNDDDSFLTFPGEPFQDDFARTTGRSPDDVIDYDESMYIETTTFVFIPVSDSMDAEDLIQQIVSVIMASMAEAAVPIDLEMFDEYPEDMPVKPNSSPESENTRSMMPYYEQNSAIKRRRSLQSSMGIDLSNQGLQFDDSYEFTVYVYDPIWFRDAQENQIIAALESERNAPFSDDQTDDTFQISMAIRMSTPEELGGLSDEMMHFLGSEDISVIESMYHSFIDADWESITGLDQIILPRLSLFNYPQKVVLDGITVAPEPQHVVQHNNEGLADLIVKKLQNSLYWPADASEPHSDMFDLRWLGVMFGFVGIVMIFVMGSITAFRRHSSGYVIMEDNDVPATAKIPSGVLAGQPATKSSTSRKVSNLPA